MLEEDYIGSVIICAEEGHGKTSMGLTFPKPLFHLDLDLNGFRRAAWRLDGTRVKVLEPGELVSGKDFSSYDIITKPYPRKVQMGKLIGPTAKKEGSGPPQIRFAKRVEGMTEMWQDIVTDIVAVCQQPLSRSIMLDTGGTWYTYAAQSHLQFLQEKQIAAGELDENKLREKLQKLEYAPVYDKMNQVMYTIAGFKKNLIMTAYPREIYAETVNSSGEVVEYRTGQYEVDGYSKASKLADLVMWVRAVPGADGKQHPRATITKCGVDGMGMDAVGSEIDATYQALDELRTQMKLLKMLQGG